MGGDDRARTRRRVILYKALPSQRLFHQSKARFKGFSGPIGSGKSQALCQEAIRLTYLNPGRLGLLGAPTYPMLRDATQTSLFEALHANQIPFTINKSENILTMTDTGSRILFRPVDEFERLRGTNLAWFGLDELTYSHEEAWLRLEGRLRDPKATRLCGFGVWTPKGYDWVYRKFLSERAEGYDMIIAKAFENRHLLDQVPDFYERLRYSYDESFFQQEVLGSYLNMSGGLVYRSFDRQLHVADLRVEPNLPIRWALDFNVDPMSSVVVQTQGALIRVLGEIVIRRATTEQACGEFVRRFGAHRCELVVYGDASGHSMKTSGSSDYEMVRDYLRASYPGRVRFDTGKANPPIRDRVNVMNAKLMNHAGESDLLVDPSCAELIKDFEQVSYKQDSMEVDKDRDRKRTHLSDALGYLVWQEYRPVPKIGRQPIRLL